MSLTEFNNKKVLYHPQTGIKVNKSKYFGYNESASSIFRKKLNEVIFGRGVDDYVLNEFKKAKYQGSFDPWSLGNKNMFNDSDNHNISSANTTIKSKNFIKTFDKNKTFNINKYDEGKNLLICKTETQYPYEFDKFHYKLNEKSNFKIKNNKLLEYYNRSSNISPKKKKGSILSSINKNKNLTYKYNSFFSPICTNKIIKTESDSVRNQNKDITKSKLIKNYNRVKEITKKTYNNRFSCDISSSTTAIDKNTKKGFSPILPICRSELKLSNIYDYINKNIYSINKTDLKQENNNNLMYSNDTENEKKNGNNKSELKLINEYRKKLLNLFLSHLTNFYIMHFRKDFFYFLSKLKKFIKHKIYHFENKNSKNKNKIKSNQYYGNNKQYQNLLKEIKNKKESKLNNIRNKLINIKKNYFENYNYDKSKKKSDKPKNIVKEKYAYNSNLNFYKNNKVEENSKKSKFEIIKKKYIKKKVSQKIKNIKPKKENIFRRNNLENNYLTSNIFNMYNYFTENIQKRKKNKSLDENEFLKYNYSFNMNIDKREITSKNSSKRNKHKRGIKPILFKKINIPNTSIKINKNSPSNKFIKIKNNSNDLNISKKNAKKRTFHINFFDKIKNKKKLSMNMRYFGFDEISLTSEALRNNNNKNNYTIDKNFTHTFMGRNNSIKNQEKEEIETFSNKNLSNAILIISKIMENKKKFNKLKLVLIKIFKNKIKKEEKHNLKLLKKYFNLLKYNNHYKKQKFLKIKAKYSLNSEGKIELNQKNYKLFNKKEFFSDNEYFDKNETEINKTNMHKNIEDFNSPSREEGKFTVVIRKIKVRKSITKSILSPKLGKIKNIRASKKPTHYLSDIDIHASGLLKPKFSFSVNNDNKLLYKIYNENENQKIRNKKEEKNVEKKRTEINESFESLENSNLNIAEEINKKNENKNNDISLHKNNNMLIKKDFLKDEGKNIIINHIRSPIENFIKHKKDKIKYNNSKSIIEGDITLNEKYQDCKNFIFFLRNQLIYCYITKTKNNNSYFD